MKNKKFKKVVILDTVIFYPEHRKLLNSIAEEVLEYPSSLPERLEEQYEESPELFLNKKCYVHISTDNIPLQLLMNRVEGADVIISCWTDIPDEILRLNPQLKLIVFWTHEKEHRLNLKLAEDLGITVANIPDYGTDAVAEVVFAGIEQLLHRNYGKSNAPKSDEEIAHSVLDATFSFFRKLQENESNTRRGKFAHHFHKLGKVKFDFGQQNLDELISERSIEHKRVGLLNLNNEDMALGMLRAFGVNAESYKLKDSSLASYYKFLAENDLVFYDSSAINKLEIERISKMFYGKLVDIQMLVTSDYSFAGKTFGVVGMGRIGVRVATIAKSLGFNIVYYSKTKKDDMEALLGARYMNLRELAEVSDVVSIHLPAHKAENLFDSTTINSMKKGALLVNTADGNAIDQQALNKRIISGEVYTYLDVYPGLPRKDILGLSMTDKSDWKIHKELSNNVLAYRAGWRTQESIRIKTYKLLGEMFDFFLGKKDKYILPDEL